MGEVVELEDQRPHTVIPTAKGATILPTQVLEEIADGKRKASEWLGFDEIAPTIVREWLGD